MATQQTTRQQTTRQQEQAQQVAAGIRRLRLAAEDLQLHIDSLLRSEGNLADQLGWQHPAVVALGAEIDQQKAARELHLARIRDLEHSLEAAARGRRQSA